MWAQTQLEDAVDKAVPVYIVEQSNREPVISLVCQLVRVRTEESEVGTIQARFDQADLYFPPSVGNCPGSSIDGAAAMKLETPLP